MYTTLSNCKGFWYIELYARTPQSQTSKPSGIQSYIGVYTPVSNIKGFWYIELYAGTPQSHTSKVSGIQSYIQVHQSQTAKVSGIQSYMQVHHSLKHQRILVYRAISCIWGYIHHILLLQRPLVQSYMEGIYLGYIHHILRHQRRLTYRAIWGI